MSNAAPPAAGRIHEFSTRSGLDTVEVGRKLTRLLKPPQLLILRGDLGTGKTTLVKGIAQALDAAEADEVTSPTFTLIHEYDGTLVLVEWGEKFKSIRKKATGEIAITSEGGDKRKITVTLKD